MIVKLSQNDYYEPALSFQRVKFLYLLPIKNCFFEHYDPENCQTRKLH